MKKVLIIANSLGGLYNFRYELLEELIKYYEVHVYVPYTNEAELLNKTKIKYHKMYIDRRSKNILKDYLLYRQYKTKIKRISPDIILTYTIKPNVYGGIAASKLKIPFIANVTGLGTAIQNPGLIKKITTKLYKKSFKKVNYVFFQNNSNKDFFIDNQLMKDNKYYVLPGSGVNLKKFTSLKYPNNKKIIITFLGRLMRDKGINELLDSVNYIDLNKVEIRLVGRFEDNNFKTKVNELVNEKKIKYLPTVKDVLPILKESDAIINPSYHEGMSNILLEAAASARPVIASNIPGCKEILDDSVSGFLFEPKNTDSLVEAINKFISLSFEERKQMGLNGRKKIEKEFNRDIVIEAYINKIEELLREKN